MSDKENVPNSVRSHYTPMDNTSFQNNRLHNQENDHRTTSSASETKYTSEMQMAESNGAPPRQPTSGPPMSPSFKVRGLKPQIWSPTQSMRSNAPAASVAAKDDNANVSAYQQQPRQNSIQDRFAVASHTPAVTGVPLAQEHDRNAFNTPNPHSGVYSPSSSSSGIISGTNSERTEELNFIQDYDRRATSALSADTEPTSVMFVERTSNEHRLPRSQNPTVTLLQKARESKDGRISLPAIDSQSSRTSTLQRPNEDDSWIRDREPSHVTRHVIHREPVKFEGIGPTNEKGLPIGLRSNIKEDNQHDWYKRMFKAIHRPEDETDYVLVKYQKPRRSSGYSPTPRNPYLSDSYMSEPESGRGDDNYSFSAAASDMENTNDYADYARTQSLPRSKASPERNVSYSSSVTPATRNYTIGNSNQPAAAATRGKESSPGYRTETSYNMASPYRNLPNKLDNYIPGNSSVSMQEAVQQEKLYNPPPETPRTQYSLTNITVGNLQPEKVIYRRGNVRALSPEEQREHYKEIQRGGDIPLSGLGMRTPQRAKERNINALTRPFKYSHTDYDRSSDFDPITARLSDQPKWTNTAYANANLYDKPVLRPYPTNRFSFFKSEFYSDPRGTTNYLDPYRRFRENLTTDGVLPAQRREVSNDFSFFRAVSGSPIPFRTSPTIQSRSQNTHTRRRVRSTSGGEADSIDAWLKKLYAELDGLDQTVAPQPDPRRYVDPGFRQQLSAQVARKCATYHKNIPASFSYVFHSPLCGTLFSTMTTTVLDDIKKDLQPNLAQSKTIASFGSKVSDTHQTNGHQSPYQRAVGVSKAVQSATSRIATKLHQPAYSRDHKDDALLAYLQRRAEKMRRLTRKLFSLSRESAPGYTNIPRSDKGRVRKLSQKYETWQRVRSGAASPISGATGFTYISPDDAWVNRTHRIRRSSSSSSLSSDKENAHKMVRSKSVPSGSHQAPVVTNNPYRHVGFDLLESSMSLDDRISSVSSFPANALDDFRRSPSSCSSASFDQHYSKYFTDSELRGMDDLKLEADIDRIAAPPSKKPLTDTGNRTLTTRDINSPYMAPSRSSGGSLERQKSLERQRSLDRQRSRTSDRDDELDLMSEYRHIDEIYEREKERRHKVQQAEEERRRHHYVPIKSPIPSDRYDSVYEDPFKFAPGRPRSASPGSVAFGRHDRARSSSVHSTYPDSELIGPCRALYSFAAQNPRELSFRQGEIVHVRQQLDANWVEGNCNNRVGIAPVSYLQSMAAEKRMRAEKPLTEGHARAKYDFNAHSQVEMSIKKGETIALIRRVDQNWYEGKIGARRGIFPVSYVEVLREVGGETVGYATYPRAPHLPSSTLPLSRPGPLSTVRPSDSNYPVSNPATPGPGSASRTNTPSLSSSASPAPRRASLVEEGSDRLRYGDDVLKEFKSQVSQISPTASPSDQLLRKSSIKSTSVLDELNIPPPPSTTVKEELDLLKREPDRCRVLYTYKAQHEDELDLREGEIITILERCDDGWFRGGNKQEQQGYFPGNYVQAL
ncbi:uncharacterized protein LOC129586424 isoform X2 [Paramacrobiotus metropolitanus]|uniref:uncharacterized protein LOC129586424 isoform X2 n=1 Tax=Paramacrobiotus metropolitanus TaxID=2943436 RepID=UPI00244638CC|nr:uncharacterized protein LOC129586424 isoform X2 [Paramacrobiotus metropolitanus]